ncbi:PYG1B-like protein [Mya arenaria]|uniref:CTP synthase n=1 Tax=Mya arenaria TaxID=6604 RepID=A0ABY7EDT0_MYAAR|nr:PYG1B-like protein [Mya arenaria]
MKTPQDSCIKRLPKAIIAGVEKGGTGTLRSFLGQHPQIEELRHPSEPYYFNDNYDKPLSWYRDLMPCTYSNQIAIEKTPSCFTNKLCPPRMYKFDKNIKLIFILREPVERAVSGYLQSHQGETDLGHKFTKDVIRPDGKTVNNSTSPVRKSSYWLHVKMWLEQFNRSNLHFVDGDTFRTQPWVELKKLEQFLGVADYFTKEMFPVDANKGERCVKGQSSDVKCMTEDKGRKHPEIDENTILPQLTANSMKMINHNNQILPQLIANSMKMVNRMKIINYDNQILTQRTASTMNCVPLLMIMQSLFKQKKGLQVGSRLPFASYFVKPSGTFHSTAISNMKYILVTGGVISGIGKGVIASSLGTILKSSGVRVTSIKIDPYINIDAGTFSPYEHGEVFVLNDGGEVDLDLGNYERFLDITLHRDNNITTGKIYQTVIDRERRGDYLGKTVQVVPHITDAIQEWVERVAKVPVDGDNATPDICIIELGGTIGDIEGMPFVEAFRQFQFRVKRENFCCVHVSLVPQPKATGEQKTKPTQSSIRELRGLGLSPDLIVCRSTVTITDAVREKVSLFCHVEPQQVMSIHDLSSIYRVPLLLENQGASAYIMRRLNLHPHLNMRPKKFMADWKELADSSCGQVHKAGGCLCLRHKGPTTLCPCSQPQAQSQGVCLGLQCAAIEFARNVLDMKEANSTEFFPETKHPVVIDMPEHNTGMMGGTMRLGLRKTLFKTDKSIMKKLYGNSDYVEERHRHRYEINPELVEQFEAKGMRFVGRKYISRPMKPSPPYFGFLLASSGKLQGFVNRGFRKSPNMEYSESSDDELCKITEGNGALSPSTASGIKMRASAGTLCCEILEQCHLSFQVNEFCKKNRIEFCLLKTRQKQHTCLVHTWFSTLEPRTMELICTIIFKINNYVKVKEGYASSSSYI